MEGKSNEKMMEQFDTDNPKVEQKKPKRKLFKRIRNIFIFIIVVGSIYIIYKRTKEVGELQRKIEKEKRKREEEKNILLDSKVIAGSVEDRETVRKWINSEISFQTKLLYRLSRDGSSIFNFHSKCDNIAPTLILIESHDENKFGGYTSASWDMFGSIYKNSTKTFLFSLTRNKKYYRKTNIKYNGDIFSGSREIGPWFGIHDLYFYGTMNDCYSYKYSGQCLFLDGNSLVDKTTIDNSVVVKEVEVYQIIFRE
jgi:hypothetical protein